MFTLNLLGGSVLEGRNGPVVGRAAHRRRLALLAVLAVARGRLVGRERIISLLWPEADTERARHLLSESLYVLRKELGEAFVTAGDEVGLDPAVVRSDVGEFEREVEEGDLERAASLYRGPFLDGFYVSEAPEFERWAEAERARLARMYTRAVECVAEAHAAAGRPQEAAEWWRKLAVQDPYNSRVGMRLMLSLDAAGERAAALWFAESHAALLREELGVEPDAEFAALVERLRSEPVRVPPPPPLPPAAEVAAGDGEAILAEPVESPPGDLAEPVEAPADPPPEPAAAPAPPPAPRRPRLRLRPVHLAGVVVLLAALGGVLLSGYRDARTERPSAPAGYDPRRIAVLYFDDHTAGGELDYLASGLTEMLIHELSQVEALDVISRNGVKPYRDSAVRFDSLVADLRVGSVVEGSVQRSGDSVRVTVQLIDANTNSHLESHTLTRPITGLFALQDAVADEVSRFLRRRLGREVHLRQTRAETRSAEAWRLVLLAEQAREDAERLGRSRETLDVGSADRLLQRADSLLERAERADPGWTRPTVLRGWVAYRRGWGAAEPRASRFRRLALRHAEQALQREPGNARALELRGTVLFEGVMVTPDSTGQARLLERAERDLRGAVAADPSLASAWSRLGQVLRTRGRFAEADLAARRALEEDAYLDGADDVIYRLYFSALFLGDYREAGSLCDQGRRRFPADWRFLECRLTLLREDRSRPPNPALAWRQVEELERLDPPSRARAQGRAYSPVYRQMVAAAVLAQAGRGDSARAVLARARHAVGDDPELRLSLAYDEAYVRLLLGEREAARALLEQVLARRPALSAFVARDPLLRELLPPSGRGAGTPRRDGGSASP